MPDQEVSFRPDQIKPVGVGAPAPQPAGEVSFQPSQITQVGGGRGGPPPAAPSAGGRGAGPGDTRRAAATPPPSHEFYPGGWKAAGQDFAGMVGGGLATAGATALLPEAAAVAGVTGVAKMLPMAARVARGAIGVAGAGAAGGGAALAEGAPLSGGEESAAAAFKRQAEMEAYGLGTGWALSGLGRRAIASRVAGKAKEWLEATRNVNMDDVTGIFQRAQDAIRSHARQGAEMRLAQTEATNALGDVVQGAKTEARGAFGAATATKEGLPQQIEGIRARGATAEAAAKARWPQTEAQVTPPQRPQGGGPARYAHTQDGFGGPDIPMYEVTDPAHALAGSHVSGATLTEHGIPIPSHTPPPSGNPTARAAQSTAEVVSGPAQRSLDKLGQAVEGAAESGPSVSLAPVKAKAQAMVAKTQPGSGEGAIPPEVQAQFGKPGAVDPALIRQRLLDAGVQLEEAHPLPGVLAKLNDLPDDVSFADAHKYKRLLDDAIGWKPAGAVKAPARGQLKQITKGVRGQIREAMAGHAPYEQATAAYRDASTLFGPQGLARKIQAAASANPEALVNSLVKPSEPSKLQMLKEVLTHHAAEGGGAEAGQEAWQQVQSTVMYKHLIQPGIENFDKSVAKMHPEFLHTLTGDPYARQVYTRLQTMSEAVKGIRDQTAMEIRGARGETARVTAGHKAVGQEARGRQWAAEGQKATLTRQGAAVNAQHAVEGQELQERRALASRDVAEARKPTDAEREFGRSSLSKPPSAASEGSDIAYAAMSPAGSPRQIAGAARLVLRGPKVNDLVRWASLSPRGTQMFVRAVTGPAPGQAIAAMIRLYDWEHGEGGPAQAPVRKAATPPPAAPR